MHTITYRPRGVCSRNMEIDVEGDVIQSVRVEGGCSGNLQGICSLLKGMTVEEAVAGWRASAAEENQHHAQTSWPRLSSRPNKEKQGSKA